MNEEQAKKLRQLDENTTLMIDTFPSIWRGLYVGLCKEGFTELESFDLVKAFISKPC